MKHLLSAFSILALGSLAMATGCSSTSATPPQDGGGGSATGAACPGIPLVYDLTGYTDKGGTGTTNVQGAWYAYGDGIGSDGTTATGDCEKLGMHQVSECSKIDKPSFGSFPVTNGKLCTMGTAAQVINLVGGTMPDYNNVWGAGVGLDLNNAGGDGGVKMPYNASTNGVTGVCFNIDMVPLAGLRVEFPTPTTTTGAAFWVRASGDQLSPVKAGKNEIRWKDVVGPFYLYPPPMTAPQVDQTSILSMQFHVPSATASAAPYAFCLSDITALTD
jgi:hypothetical protein